MMSVGQEENLQHIISVANETLSSLGCYGICQENTKTVKTTQALASEASQIAVPLSYLDHFRNSLIKRSISRDLLLQLEGLYARKIEQIRTLCQARLDSINGILIDGGDVKLLQEKAKQVMQLYLQNAIVKIHQATINTIGIKVSAFQKKSSTSNDFENSSDSSVAQKGHSPRAVAILEKVFAQTNNINRSEKFQLAKATKLEPRQVTIWFQNRRNRKPASQAPASNKKTGTHPATQQRKRKFQEDEEDNVPHTPTQRRRVSESDIATLTTPSSFRYDTPSSSIAASDRSSSAELFERNHSNQSQGGTSCATSYDDCFSSYQSGNSSPPGSTFGMKSFDDQVIRFTKVKMQRSISDDKKEMMFNENGEVILDWDDLELNLEDFNESMSQAISPGSAFTTNKHSNLTDLLLPNSKQETNDLILSFARKLVEEDFNAQQGLEKVQQNEGWQTQVYDKIFLAKEAEQDIISLADVQSSQTSNPSGSSTANSTQTSPRANTPRSLFSFDFDNLGLDDIIQYNNESIEQQINSIDLFAPEELLKFEPLTSDMLGLICSPSASTDTTMA